HVAVDAHSLVDARPLRVAGSDLAAQFREREHGAETTLVGAVLPMTAVTVGRQNLLRLSGEVVLVAGSGRGREPGRDSHKKPGACSHEASSAEGAANRRRG